MGSEPQFVTRAQFARMRGVSRVRITHLAHAGRIVLNADGKLVDVEATLAKLEATRDAIKLGRAKGDRPAAKSNGRKKTLKASAAPTYWTNKSHREGAMAELAELEVGRRRGELVDAAQVRKAAFDAARLVRDSMLALPAQLAPEFAVISDAFAIEQRLRQALRRTLEDLAKMSDADLARALKQA